MSARHRSASDSSLSPPPLELAGPFDNQAALETALKAGPQAVLLLPATRGSRRDATGLAPDQLQAAVAQAHAAQARAYLDLATPLSPRQLGQAVRLVELARQIAADGVVLRDAALLALRDEYSVLEFLWDPSGGVLNSADAAAGGDLHVARGVLGSGLTPAEMAAAAAGQGGATAVRGQLHSCPCLAGSCQVNSWTGGGAAADAPCPLGEELQRLMPAHASPHAASAAEVATVKPADPQLAADDTDDAALSDEGPMYDFHIDVTPQGIACRCECEGRLVEWTLPKTLVRRPQKAVPISRFMESLEETPIQGYRLGLGSTNEPDYLLVPRAIPPLYGRITEVIRLARKGPDRTVRVTLPEPVQALLAKAEPHPGNRRTLGQSPDRVRLDHRAAVQFLRQIQVQTAVVEGLNAQRLERLLESVDAGQFVAALPAWFLEEDLAQVERLVQACVAARVPVEVNSWGGWRLAQQAQATLEAGPGLAVHNALAAQVLGGRGVQCVTLAPQLDRRQLEELTAQCPVPCSLIVVGRPLLSVARFDSSDQRLEHRVWHRHGPQITARREQRLWHFRPAEPFDWRALENPQIRAQHLVADLVASPDPVGEWQGIPLDDTPTFRWNYERGTG